MIASERRTAAEPRDGFRPDLEGLRAIAVALVLFYHAAVPGFGGGYVGVDAFFVLSGFLITGILLRELRRSGTISLAAFYARRARRLLPASALVLLSTLAASVVMMPPLRVPDVAGDAAAAALYVSNIRFALQATDYLRAELAPSPLLHFWSLGVEEQFYLVWPALVLCLARGRVDASRRIGIAAGAIAFISFGMSHWLTETHAPWAFFSLATRAWELGLGAILAVGAATLARIPERAAATSAWVGLAMVIAAGMVLDAGTPFPGAAALLPAVGSALVIAGGFRDSPLAPGRWLSRAVPRFLGRISYSLYLWHWPALTLPVAALDAKLPWWARGALALVAVGLAAATQRWIEAPLRDGRGVGTLPRRNLAMAGAFSGIAAAVSLSIAATTASSLQRPASADLSADEQALDAILAGRAFTPTLSGPLPVGLRPSLGAARADYPLPYGDGCHVKEGAATESGACTYGASRSSTTVVLFGDSHALSWFPAVNRLAIERGWRLVNLTMSSCTSAVVSHWNGTLKRAYTECDEWRENSYRRIEAERPALLLIASSRQFSALGSDGTTKLNNANRSLAWRQGMAKTLARLTPVADQIVLIGDIPRSAFDVPVCLSEHPDDSLACATPFERSVSQAWLAEEATAADRGGAGFVDPTPWVCPSTPCPAVIGNFMVLRDAHHLTAAFSSALWRRLGSALDAGTPSSMAATPWGAVSTDGIIERARVTLVPDSRR